MKNLSWANSALILIACMTVAGLSACSDPTEETPGPSQPACLKIPVTAASDWQEAFDASDDGAFLSVWGPSPCEVYTVGGQPGTGVMFAFDGESWTEVALPEGTPMLHWVHGIDGELWMVGENGVTLRGTAAGGFETIQAPTTVPLWGVWATASNDVWTVGGDIFDLESSPVLLRFDGTAWTEETLPETDRPANALFKIMAIAADDVLAVGQFGLVYHYDGAAWTEVPSGTGDDLISLWGLDSGNIAVAGGRSNGVLARWDGSALSVETLIGTPGLNGIWMDAEGTAHVVGIFGAIAQVPTGGFESSPEIAPSMELLHGTFGFDGGPRFAVGGSLNRNPPYTGVVLIDP